MCFSATASFSAAGFLCVVGIVAMRLAKSKSYYMIASIPLLFSIQQAFEGIAWLTHANNADNFLYYLSTRIFLIFAFLIWPIWIPTALFVAEKIKTRRKLLAGLITLGTLLSIVNAYLLTRDHNSIAIISNHISYGADFASRVPFNFLLFIYACAVILPCFITSSKWWKTFGVLLLISLVVTHLFMIEAFTSVWCYFSAVLSCMILFLVRA